MISFVGNPPLAETLVLASLLTLLVSVPLLEFKRGNLRAVLRPGGTPQRLVSLTLLGLPLVLLLLGTGGVAARSLGSWRPLKAELHRYQAVLAAYEAKHGAVDTYNKLRGFYEAHPQHSFTVVEGRPELTVSALPSAGAAKVGVIYSGGTAVFHQATMVCIHFEGADTDIIIRPGS